MSEARTAFLITGMVLAVILVLGLATGRMLWGAFTADREETPFWFWTNGACIALLALLCFYMASAYS